MALSIYVRKWIRTSHALVFRLSNKVVQVNFKDTSLLVMASTTRKVMYISKSGEKEICRLEDIDKASKELSKRLNYARQVLEFSIKQGSSKKSGILTTGR